MSEFRLSSPGGLRVPRFGEEVLHLVAAIALAAGAWGLAAGYGMLAGGVAVLGGAGLLLLVHRQARATRFAAELSGAQNPGWFGLAASLRRIAERLHSVEHRLTHLHPITGLATREPLVLEMAADIEGSPSPRLLAAIRFVDFDRLAAFDQDAANLALERFARRLVAATRQAHLIGQIDRDCFAIWFRAEDQEAAAAELRSIVYVAGQEIVGEDSVLTPTIEAGSVRWQAGGADPAQLLVQVGAALAAPAVSAGGVVTLAEPASADDAREIFALEQDLAQAIAEEQLNMVFQPVVDLASGRLIGAEALLRWDHPSLGLVSPARFIPVVEQIGLSERYGMWVLNAACRQARRWQDEGIVGLKVAVNLSARQLLDPTLPSKIERTLVRHALGPKALELELTETAAMADAARTHALFAQLRATGVSISVDDFGSGYSSMSYLKNLPFDKLKIDREFVTDVDSRRDSRAICKALIELGRGLDLLVLAEGVENAREVETLRDLGCDVFQGYFFSKPLSADDFVTQAKDPAWLSRLRPPAARRPNRFQVGRSA